MKNIILKSIIEAANIPRRSARLFIKQINKATASLSPPPSARSIRAAVRSMRASSMLAAASGLINSNLEPFGVQKKLRLTPKKDENEMPSLGGISLPPASSFDSLKTKKSTHKIGEKSGKEENKRSIRWLTEEIKISKKVDQEVSVQWVEDENPVHKGEIITKSTVMPASSNPDALHSTALQPASNGRAVLESKNRHERDSNIEFIEYCHRYIITGKEPELYKRGYDDPYTSVTAFINSHFSKFDSDNVIKNMTLGTNWNKCNRYWGMSPFQIKKAWKDNGAKQARLGTQMHRDIEYFMNNDIRDDGSQIDYTHKDILDIHEFVSENKGDEKPEWSYFLNFVRDHPEFKPYRTEMRIYSEQLKIAGSIDMLYKNSDGSFSIYDWKRSKEIQKYNIYKKFSTTESVKHLPDLNFVHYSLQLHLYKYILEKNYNFKIKDLFLVQLHPNFKNYRLHECLDLTNELDILLKERQATL